MCAGFGKLAHELEGLIVNQQERGGDGEYEFQKSQEICEKAPPLGMHGISRDTVVVGVTGTVYMRAWF